MKNSQSYSQHRQRCCIILSAAISIAALLAPMAIAADSYPPADYSAVASAQPVVSGYRVQDIRDWTPESDPYAKYLRATVPLQTRIGHNADTQVKPELDGKAEIMLMQGDYGNSFFGSTTHNNTFTDLAFNFWQYIDFFSPWHGGASIGVPQAIYDPQNSDWRNRGFEFGIMTLPTPEYTNAAHRNGVKSVAILYFDPYFRPGLTFKELFDKDPQSDGYIIADKLVEMAKYYGFDGYFLNEEEGGARREEFKPFMAYLTSKGLYTQWYDTNSRFDERKAQWLRDDTNGRIHNSVFVNYGNNGKTMRAFADANGYDPYAEVFAGIEANQTNFGGDGGVSRGFVSQENHSPVTSLALFTPSDMYQRGLDDDIKNQTGRESPELPFMQQQPYQWMIAQRERMYFSGTKSDVTKTGATNVEAKPEVGVTRKGWIGVADFTPARSVIAGSKFASTFSTGKGMRSYTNGIVTNQNQWTDIGAQAILPSWQWWFESDDGQVALQADFDYGEEPRLSMSGEQVSLPFQPIGGYNGGNSLVVYGDIHGTQTLRLFKTDLDVVANSNATLIWRASQAGDANVSLGLIFEDKPKEVVPLKLGKAPQQWEKTSVDLSAYAGRKISTIGLVFEGEAVGAQFNVGELRVGPANGTSPASPTGLQVDELLSDGQMNVHWDRADFADVDYYILEAVGTDGQVTHLARTYGDVRYVKNVLVSGDFTVRLRAIGKDGSSSAPAEVSIPRSKLPREVTVTEDTDGNNYFMQAKSAKEVTVNWVVPTAGAPEAYDVRIETLFAGEDNPYRGYAHATVSGSETALTLPAPPEGLHFRATVTPVGVESGVGMSVRSRYHDSLARGVEKRDIVLTGGMGYHLNNPTTSDWQQVIAQGDEEWTATRGKNANRSWGNNDPNARLTNSRELKSDVTYTIVDYAGNKSAPFKLAVSDGSITIVDEEAPRVWASPWNNQDVSAGAKLESISAAASDNASIVKLSAGFLDRSAEKETVLSLTDGITFDAETGVISGVPTWDGTRILRITGVDESGNTAHIEISIKAHGIPDPEPVPSEDDGSEDLLDDSLEGSSDNLSQQQNDAVKPSPTSQVPTNGVSIIRLAKTGAPSIGFMLVIAIGLTMVGIVRHVARRRQ